MTDGYNALRHGAAWLDLSSRGRFVARGRDRTRFLHNVTSNDIKKLTPGAGCYAFLLTPQGRIQADLTIFCFADHFLIDTEPDLREKVPGLILKYKVADQIELEDVSAQGVAIGLEGPGAAAVLSSAGAPVPGADFAHLAWGEAIVAAVSATGQPGYRMYGPADLAHRLEAAGAKPATAEDARAVRIENGKPRYGDDIRETMLPQETGQLHAVSYTKGCYIGQEIVERIRTQAHINRKLVRLDIDAPEAVAPGTKLTAGSAEVGEVTSSVYSPESGKVIALAYVRAAQAEPGTSLKTPSAAAMVSPVI